MTQMRYIAVAALLVLAACATTPPPATPPAAGTPTTPAATPAPSGLDAFAAKLKQLDATISQGAATIAAAALPPICQNYPILDTAFRTLNPSVEKIADEQKAIAGLRGICTASGCANGQCTNPPASGSQVLMDAFAAYMAVKAASSASATQ